MSDIDLYKGDCLDIVAVSLFDGLSGGRIALERTPNLNVLRYYSSEVDKYAIQVADKNYPQDTEFRLGDVTKIDFVKLKQEIQEEFGDIEILLVGGFPCQSYSMAGKREGINSTNGQLIYDVFRAIEDLNPDNVLLENVKGLVTIDKGETFKHILQELNLIGYAVDFININSNLVSAQNRERVYIIGKRLDNCKGLYYNMPYSKENINATLKKSTHGRIS